MSNKRSAKPGEARAFLEAAIQSNTDECIIWPFSTTKDGYGRMKIGGRKGRPQTVNRLVALWAHGEPPGDGYHAAHDPLVCTSKACVNPRHIRWATRSENERDKLISGSHHKAKLTHADADEIRASSLSNKSLAAKFNVSVDSIEAIRRGRTWAKPNE